MKTYAVSILALAIATQAHAQSAPPADAGQAASTDTNTDSDEIVVSATRSGDAIPADLIGSSVTVIDDQQLQARQTRFVIDALRDVPGVAVNRGVGGAAEVRIRGSEANHTLVFVDGIKSDDPYSAQFDYATLINDEASRVEVLRGQQSSLYGSDAIGGVINYTTLSGREAPGVSLRAEGGSMGTYAGGARAGGVIGDTFDYAVSSSYYRTDGYAVAPGGSRDVGSRTLGTTAKFDWTPTSNFKLTGVGRYSFLHQDLDSQDVSAASPTVLGYPLTVAVDTPGDYTRNRAWSGILGASWDLFDGAWTNAASAAITDDDRHYDGPFGPSGDHGRRYRTTFNSTVRFGSDHVKNRFTYGMDYERQEFRNTTAFTDDARHTLETFGYVADYDLTVDDRLAISASARIDHYNLFQDAATYRATASYRFPTGTRVHAAYGTGIKAPNPGELYGYSVDVYIGNPNLRPEKSKGWEAGVEQKLLADRVTIGATYFKDRLRNEIIPGYAYDTGSGIFVQTSLNAASSIPQQGVEAYANVAWRDFRLDATYTYLHAPQEVNALTDPAPADGSLFGTETLVRTQAVRRAKNIASLNLTYAPKAIPLSTTVTVRYNGRQRDYAFTSPYFQTILADLSSYTIVNLNVSYDINPHLQLFARAENLANEKYQETFGYRSPRRGVYGGARIKL